MSTPSIVDSAGMKAERLPCSQEVHLLVISSGSFCIKKTRAKLLRHKEADVEQENGLITSPRPTEQRFVIHVHFEKPRLVFSARLVIAKDASEENSSSRHVRPLPSACSSWSMRPRMWGTPQPSVYPNALRWHASTSDPQSGCRI